MPISKSCPPLVTFLHSYTPLNCTNSALLRIPGRQLQYRRCYSSINYITSTGMDTQSKKQEIIDKSTFKTHVPADSALRLSADDFSDHLDHLFKVLRKEQKRHRVLRSQKASDDLPASDPEHEAEESLNSFMNALEDARVSRKRGWSSGKLEPNEMRTENADIAYKSTQSPLVDLFYELEKVISPSRLEILLTDAWLKSPIDTLKTIWNARSIHLGKSSQKVFYRCCGWLADNHPQTLIQNLRWLSRPIIPKKAPKQNDKKDEADDEDYEYIMLEDMSLDNEGNPLRFDVRNGVAHGYWKDLLNILALAANDKLHVGSDPSEVLNVHEKSDKRERVWDSEKAKGLRAAKKDTRFETIQRLFADNPFYRALHLSVARLFGEQLKRDIEHLEAKKDARELSLVAKWAPTGKGFHDRQTLIASSIAEYLFDHNSVCSEIPLDNREHYLRHAREALRGKVVSPLRKALAVVERDITANTYSNIRYERVPSIAMNRYSSLFIKKDTDRFEKYIEGVAAGTKKISGATLLPSTLVRKALACPSGGSRVGKSAKEMIEQKAKDMEAKVVDGQWKTLVQRINDSGTIENSIAVCDVSGSMSYPNFSDGTCPMDSSVGLALLLAEVTKPPFGGYFITFSSNPEIQKVGGASDTRSLREKLSQIVRSHWGMNTDFVAVFERLLLPMAVENKVAPEDMVKQVFVFSDMQFDQCGGTGWRNSFQKVKKQFNDAGYELPRLIFWNLAGGRAGYTGVGDDTAPKPTTAEEDNVALVSGYSQGQLKMFLDNGQFGDEEEEEEEAVEVKEGDDGEAVVVEHKKKNKFDPETIFKKAISHKAYDMLKVVD